MKTQTPITEIHPNYQQQLKGVIYESITPPNERIINFLKSFEKIIETSNQFGSDYLAGLNHAKKIASIWFEAEIEANKQLTQNNEAI